MHTTQILDLADLRTRAREVTRKGRIDTLCARSAARALAGIAAIVSRQYGTEAMVRAMAQLAGDQAAWDVRMTRFRLDPSMGPELEMVATAARALIAVSSVDAVRAAVAFWATERDPVVWQQVTAGVAA